MPGIRPPGICFFINQIFYVMDQKTIDQLVTCRALLLFLYNFKSADIQELCKNQQFKYSWDKLCAKTKDSGFIDFKEFYDSFSTNMSYKTQALVLKKAMEVYEQEARNSIAFSIVVDKKIKEARA